jgi:hypothetical protein
LWTIGRALRARHRGKPWLARISGRLRIRPGIAREPTPHGPVRMTLANRLFMNKTP